MNRCIGKHSKSVGRPTIFTHKEQLISKILGVVAERNFTLNKQGVKMVNKKYLNGKSTNIPTLTKNTLFDYMKWLS